MEEPLETVRNENPKLKTLISPHGTRRLAPGTRTLTVAAVVVHQDDLLEQVRWRALHGRVDGAQQHRERLVDEDEHDAHLW